jgi:hypothetical protein
MLALLLSLLLTEAKPVAVPFDLLKTRHMTVQVKLNGKGPYRFLFDTGAPLNIIGQQAARDSGLTAALGTSRAQVRSLELGELKAADVPVVVVDHPAVAALSRAAGPIHGIIGFPFFARYRMTLDYQAQRLTFVPSGYEPADILQALMDILMRSSKPTPTVLAAAGQWGLVVDRVADCYRAASHVSPGQPAPVVVRRDGRELNLTVKPRIGI